MSQMFARNVFRNIIYSHNKYRLISAAKSSKELVQNQDAAGDLNLSDECVKRLNHLCKDSNTFLRLSVEGGGCSGFQYKFDLEDKILPEDKIFEKDGAKLVIDEISLEYVQGATVDYHEELIKSAFRVIKNPKAELGCSCGASFSIKLD